MVPFDNSKRRLQETRLHVPILGIAPRRARRKLAVSSPAKLKKQIYRTMHTRSFVFVRRNACTCGNLTNWLTLVVKSTCIANKSSRRYLEMLT